jgi:predicted secreted Zn-dependent protease
MVEPARRSGIRIRIGRAGVVVLEIGLLGSAVAQEPADVGALMGLEGRPAETAAADLPRTDLAPLSAAAPATLLLELAPLTIEIPGASVVYFSVAGTSSDELWSSVYSAAADVCGPVNYSWYAGDPRSVACSRYVVGYLYPTSDTTCVVSSVGLIQTVYLPQWMPSAHVPPQLLDWWRAWQGVAVEHEAGHVAIAADWLPALEGRLVGLDCAQASAVYDATLAQLAAAEEAYDRQRYANLVYPDPPD